MMDYCNPRNVWSDTGSEDPEVYAPKSEKKNPALKLNRQDDSSRFSGKHSAVYSHRPIILSKSFWNAIRTSIYQLRLVTRFFMRKWERHAESPHENKINVSTCQPATMIWWQQTADYLYVGILVSRTMKESISAAQNYPFVVMDYYIYRKLIIC